MALESDFDFAPYLGWLRKSAGADYAVVDLEFNPFLADGGKEVLAKCEAVVRATPAVKPHHAGFVEQPLRRVRRPAVLTHPVRSPGAGQGGARGDAADGPPPARRRQERESRAARATSRRRRAASRAAPIPSTSPFTVLTPRRCASGPTNSPKATSQKRRRWRDVWLNPDAQPRPSRYVDVNREQAAVRGVDLSDFFTTLEVFFGSTSLAPPLHLFGRGLPCTSWRGFFDTPRRSLVLWPVVQRYKGRPLPRLKGVSRLRKSPAVRNSKGQMIPVSTFATVRERETSALFDFFNLRPMSCRSRRTPQPASISPPRARSASSWRRRRVATSAGCRRSIVWRGYNRRSGNRTAAGWLSGEWPHGSFSAGSASC